ncbi:uncharacterized protein LOC102364816 [Latimeria chalumnae]|uniref:uncharacterized protein LOC102364816 n=1 Tax=Latimeria chalumnae TaxID=7897 RepID=UPI0003C16DBD|nr:PREDICTED: uncharacterized protein LOC102364816 [Latimeria chalumnae]|eukprot:XP_006001363.1 PREDICTED: uncharacterized protein LOC102364816 [Latimeria chalumnae]
MDLSGLLYYCIRFDTEQQCDLERLSGSRVVWVVVLSLCLLLLCILILLYSRRWTRLQKEELLKSTRKKNSCLHVADTKASSTTPFIVEEDEGNPLEELEHQKAEKLNNLNSNLGIQLQLTVKQTQDNNNLEFVNTNTVDCRSNEALEYTNNITLEYRSRLLDIEPIPKNFQNSSIAMDENIPFSVQEKGTNSNIYYPIEEQYQKVHRISMTESREPVESHFEC